MYTYIANKGNFGWAVLDYVFGTMDAWVHLGGMEAYTAAAAPAAAPPTTTTTTTTAGLKVRQKAE